MKSIRKIFWNEEFIGSINIIGAEMNKVYGHWKPNVSVNLENIYQSSYIR